MPSAQAPRPAIAALYTGLALTIAATALVHLDRSGLTGHIRTGFPDYPRADIDTAATVYLVYLSVLGGLGVAGWLAAIWATRRRKSWTRWLSAGLFTVGALIAGFNLTVTDVSGDTGLPPLIGWAGVLPCLAGLAAVVLGWRAAGPKRAN